MSGPETLVSVIIPVFNGENHLAECLASVRRQSYQQLEIIVVNDGSTDATQRILHEAEQQDGRVVSLHQANAGVSAARNAGLDAATGEWVMFVDADDMMRERILVETIVLAGQSDHAHRTDITGRAMVDLVCFETSSDELPHPRGETTGAATQTPAGVVARARDYSLDAATLAEMIASETLNALWDKAYRRDVITWRQCRFPEGTNMGEDLLFNLMYVRVDTRVRSIPLVGYFYRRSNTESVTSRYLPGKYEDLMTVCDYVHGWARQFDVAEVRGAADYIRAKNVVSCIRDLHHKDCELSPRQRLATAQRYKSLVPTVRVGGIGAKRRALGECYNVLGFRPVFHLTRLLGHLR